MNFHLVNKLFNCITVVTDDSLNTEKLGIFH